jgi:hypothetical protein
MIGIRNFEIAEVFRYSWASALYVFVEFGHLLLPLHAI